jgi:hypothetical protein
MFNSWLRLKFEGRSGRDENVVCRLIFGCAGPTEKPLNPLFFVRLELIFPQTFLIVKIITRIFSVKSLINTQNMDVIHNHE